MSESNQPARNRSVGKLPGKKQPDARQLLDSLAAAEDDFVRHEFLAPAVAGGSVRVNIAGAICKIAIEPSDFVGWGVFQPRSHSSAQFVRPASLLERRRYLELFPLVRSILCRRTDDGWQASAASFGDGRIQLEGVAPVLLVEEAQLFDRVCTRFDGTAFWFDEVDMRHDPAAATYLRQALVDRTRPEDLECKGLTAEERAAFEVHYWETVGCAERRDRKGAGAEPADNIASRLQANLSHAGARLVDYLERDDSFRVTYTIGRRRYTSSVDKRTLTVQVAGICLSGEDRKFDLASLVGVLREGEGHGMLHVGDGGMAEDDYWRVHPPRR